ncbi:MAG TPA: hypothetical protein VGB55_07550 [Tepidisphaeraceae bacterium]|jgi:hypothetical protein
MDDATLSTLLTAGLVGVLLISGWATLCLYLARHSGWNQLASAYGGKTRADATPRRFQTVRLMPSGQLYPASMTLRLTMEGMYLVPSRLVRFGHPPLLVPWNDIEIFAVETYPADRLYDLQFAGEPTVKIRVGVKAAQYIRRAADNAQYFVEETAPRPKPVAAKQINAA